MPALSPEEIVQLGAALRAAREILRYKLPELAEAAAVDVARLRDFEDSRAIPTHAELARIWDIISSDLHVARVRINRPRVVNGTRP